MATWGSIRPGHYTLETDEQKTNWIEPKKIGSSAHDNRRNSPHGSFRIYAGWEACDTAGWETCATKLRSRWCANVGRRDRDSGGRKLARLEWAEHDVMSRTKSDPGKLAIAARLRRETTLPLQWIAAGVQIGTTQGAKALLHLWI